MSPRLTNASLNLFELWLRLRRKAEHAGNLPDLPYAGRDCVPCPVFCVWSYDVLHVDAVVVDVLSVVPDEDIEERPAIFGPDRL